MPKLERRNHDADLDPTGFSQDWVTGTAASTARIYFEQQQPIYTGDRNAGKVPVGVALFPKDIDVPAAQVGRGAVQPRPLGRNASRRPLAALETPAW